MSSKLNIFTAKKLVAELAALAGTSKGNSRFFHGNPATEFFDVRMGTLFAVAKKYTAMPVDEVSELLDSNYFEVRMAGVCVMDFKAREKNITAIIKMVK